MKRRLGMVLSMVLALALFGMSAYAMPIKVSDGTFDAQATLLDDDNSSYALSAEEFQLLGTDESGAYLIYADDRFMKVDKGAMSIVLDQIGEDAAASLPALADLSTLQRGNRGEAVTALQNSLKKLEYLSGSADGDFGGQSERAVSAFQEALGMEETGVADGLLQMLAQSMSAFTRIISSDADPAERFSDITGKTEANLARAGELGLTLDYDDISGIGMITNGNSLEYSPEVTNDIDRRTFTLRFGLGVEQNADGVVDVGPILEVTCVGVQRPILQEVILKSGDERHTASVSALQSGLTGLDAKETARVPLDDDTMAMLANAAEEGELRIRLVCKYDSYDITVPKANLARISEIGDAGTKLK